MELWVVKDKVAASGFNVSLVAVEELEHACANVHGLSHNDAVTHTLDGVALAMVGCIKQVVSCLLKLQREFIISSISVLCVPMDSHCI